MRGGGGRSRLVPHGRYLDVGRARRRPAERPPAAHVTLDLVDRFIGEDS